MKIKLPLTTMLAGFKRGGAVALAYRGAISRQEDEVLNDPCGLIRITASKKDLTFESGDRHRWVSHIVAVDETDSDNPVEVKQEGAWCFDIGQLYPFLKAMGKSARAEGSAHRLEMQYAPDELQPTPPVEGVTERMKACGHLIWEASNDEDGASKSSICAFPACAIHGAEGKVNKLANPPMTNATDEFLWELEAKAVQASLALVRSVKMLSKPDHAMVDVGLSIQHGCGSFFCATKTSAVIREITPSEIIGQDKLKAQLLFSSDGLDALDSVLVAATERKSPNNTRTVKMFLLHDQQTLRFEVGMTNLFIALRHAQEKITSSDTIANLSTNLSALLALRPGSSFTVDTKPLLRTLEHALSSSMQSQRIDASLDPKESILELYYAPNPLLRKFGQSMHPASGDMRCYNFQQQQTPQSNNAMPIDFSFSPQPVVEFIKASKCDKVTLELLRANNAAPILRVRPVGNRKETFVCSLIAK